MVKRGVFERGKLQVVIVGQNRRAQMQCGKMSVALLHFLRWLAKYILMMREQISFDHFYCNFTNKELSLQLHFYQELYLGRRKELEAAQGRVREELKAEKETR